MRPTAFAATCTLAALLLAGCGGSPGQPPAEVGPDVFVAEGSSYGAIAGVVVDLAIRPLAGATVALMGSDQTRTADEGGQFAFEDLEPGSYFLNISAPRHGGVQTSVEVVAGEVSRVKAQLEPFLGVEPFHQTFHYQGYIEASGAVSGPIVNIVLDEFGDNPFCQCTLVFNTTGLDVKTLVVEAFWEDTVADPRGPTDLYLEVFPRELDDSTDDIKGGFLFSPVLEHYPIEAWGEDEQNVEWRARLSGSADHVNYSQRYDLFVTVFANEPAPDGWSLVQGDI